MAPGKAESARIEVTEHGPYRVSGDVAIRDTEGNLLRQGGTWHLCRCGGSRNKPFCDATHGLKNFDGAEAADHGPIASRREAYRTPGITVYDDRTVCAHFGQCTARLPAVFRADSEPFVDPEGAAATAIADVVASCPSGALAFALGSDAQPSESNQPPSTVARTSAGSAVRCAAAGNHATSHFVTVRTGMRASAIRSLRSWSSRHRRSSTGLGESRRWSG
jgi:CDGSH-type Zn-finger protein/ferredoxin